MRPVVVFAAVLTMVSGAVVHAQSMAEAGAAIAGGTVGGAAGKSVSQGITAIFDKVDKQAAAAAGADSKTKKAAKTPPSNAPTVPGAALIEAGPGQPQAALPSVAARTGSSARAVPAGRTERKPKPSAEAEASVVADERWDDVPPPPPLANHASLAAAKPAPAPAPAVAAVAIRRTPAPPPPPVVVPPVTLEDLQKVSTGMTRHEVLQIGQPASRITMFEDGGLLEIFSYHSKDPQFGDRTLGTIRLTDGMVSSVQWRP